MLVLYGADISNFVSQNTQNASIKFEVKEYGKWELGGNLIIPNRLERISIECLRAKTKVITTTNQMIGKRYKEPIRTHDLFKFFYLIGCENGASFLD